MNAVPQVRRCSASARKVGFTLVELLVVIGIIALLISILIPALAKAKQHAQRTACASNIRQLAMALRVYTEDWKGSLPFSNASVPPADRMGWLYTQNRLSNPRRAEDVKSGAFFPILKNYKVFRCPADVDGTSDPFSGSVYPLTSYTSNVCIGDWNQNFRPYKVTQFKSSGVVFWEPDEMLRGLNWVWDDGTSAANQASITRRHGKTTSVACVDGHVETYTRDQFNSYAGASGARAAPVPNPLWCRPGDATGGRSSW